MVGKTILVSGKALVRRARFGLVALAATAMVATATVLPAAATSTTPVQVVGPPSILYSVACSTPTTCYAVGFGVRFEIIPITNGVAGPPTEFPPGYGFDDVVCPSATTCVVYGGFTPPGSPNPNRPRERFPTQPIRVVITNGVIGPPENIPYRLNQVACFDATYCVGLTILSDGTFRQAVVVITNGSFGQPQFLPAGVESLKDVACASATTCFAVGQTPEDPAYPDIFGNPQPIGAVVPIINGVLGAVQVVPVASGLNGVACASATTCYAVGNNNDIFNPQQLVVPIVNGTAGTAVAAPGVDSLNGIACLTAAICEAVGFRNNNGVGEAVVVPIVNGSPGPTHVVTGATSLDHVACSAPTCVAIGYLSQGGTTVGVVTVITEPDLMCNGKLATVVGTAGADRLFGTSGPDVILGLGGADSIYSYGGNDTICGGDGNDVVYGGDGNDYIDAGNGDDRAIGDAGNDMVLGGDGSDRIFANGGTDTLNGGPALDYCYKGSGSAIFVDCEVFPTGR